MALLVAVAVAVAVAAVVAADDDAVADELFCFTDAIISLWSEPRIHACS